MIIKEDRLKQIIRQEIELHIIEQIIDEEFEAFLLESDAYDRYKAQDRKDLKSKVAKSLAGLTAATGAGFTLQQNVDDLGQAKKASAKAAAQKNYEASSTIENAAKELQKRAANVKLWMWTSTDTQTLPFPTNPENHSEAVLPPEWSVMAQVAIDMKAQKPKYPVDKNYLQVANNPDSLSSAYKNIKGNPSKGPHKNFFKTFSPDTYPFFDASELGINRAMFPAETGLPSAMLDLDGDGGPDLQNIVYIPFDELPDDYVMPLSGLTKSDYYKKSYYGDGMSLEMFKNLKGAKPSVKESKITWQNYKNRKKKLA